MSVTYQFYLDKSNIPLRVHINMYNFSENISLCAALYKFSKIPAKYTVNYNMENVNTLHERIPNIEHYPEVHAYARAIALTPFHHYASIVQGYKIYDKTVPLIYFKNENQVGDYTSTIRISEIQETLVLCNESVFGKLINKIIIYWNSW